MIINLIGVLLSIASATLYKPIQGCQKNNTEFSRIFVQSGEAFQIPITDFLVGPFQQSNVTNNVTGIIIQQTTPQIEQVPNISVIDLQYMSMNNDPTVQLDVIGSLQLNNSQYQIKVSNQSAVYLEPLNTTDDCQTLDWINGDILINCLSYNTSGTYLSFYVYLYSSSIIYVPPILSQIQISNESLQSTIIQSQVDSLSYSIVFQTMLIQQSQGQIRLYALYNASNSTFSLTSLQPISQNISFIDYFVAANGTTFFLQKNCLSVLSVSCYNPTPEYSELYAMSVYEFTPDTFYVSLQTESGIYTQVLFAEIFSQVRFNKFNTKIQGQSQIQVTPQYLIVSTTNEIIIFPGPDNNINQQIQIYSLNTNSTFYQFSCNLLEQEILFYKGNNLMMVQMKNPVIIGILDSTQYAEQTLTIQSQCLLPNQTIQNITFNLSIIILPNMTLIPLQVTSNTTIVGSSSRSKSIILSQYFSGPALAYNVSGLNIEQIIQVQLQTTALQSQLYGNTQGLNNNWLIVVYQDLNFVIHINRCQPFNSQCRQISNYTLTNELIRSGLTYFSKSRQLIVGLLDKQYELSIIALMRGQAPRILTQFTGIGDFLLLENYLYLIYQNGTFTVYNLYGSLVTQIVADFVSIQQHIYCYGNALALNTISGIFIIKTYQDSVQLLNSFSTIYYPQGILGSTKFGLYLLNNNTNQLELVIVSTQIIMDIPSFNYTLNPYAVSSTMTHFYIAASMNQKYYVLVYQESYSSISSLYVVLDSPGPVQWISTTGYNEYDIIQIRSDDTITTYILMNSPSIEILPYVGTTSQHSQTISVLVQSFTAQDALYNYDIITPNLALTLLPLEKSLQLNQVLPSNNIVTYNPREFLLGNIVNYSMNANSKITLQEPIKSYLSLPYNNSVSFSQQAFNSIVMGQQKNQNITYAQNSSMVIAYIDSKWQKLYDLNQTCAFLFVEFYTQNPISVCSQNTSLSFIVYDINTSKTSTYNYTSSGQITNFYYLNGIVQYTVQSETNCFGQNGFVIAKGTQFLFQANEQYPLICSSTFASLNISLGYNITQPYYLLFGLLEINNNRANLYCFNYEIHPTVMQELYQANTTLTNITYRAYRMPQRFLFLPNLIGNGFVEGDSIFAAIQSAKSQYYGEYEVPIILLSQTNSYAVSLMFSGQGLYDARYYCTFQGLVNSQPQSIYQSLGSIVIVYNTNVSNQWTLATYGNYEQQCYNSTSHVVYSLQQVNISQESLINVVSNSQTPQLVVQTQTESSISGYIYVLLDEIVYLVSSGNQQFTTSIIGGNGEPISMTASITGGNEGETYNKHKSLFIILYVVLGLAIVVGIIVFLCYRSRQKKDDPNRDIEIQLNGYEAVL